VENSRPDCSFIYLTHDIDFAFSRHSAIKVWAKSYLGANTWDYEILDGLAPVPEQLYLEILGSRNPVLFLEGDDSSIDYKLYEQVYPAYTIKPLGSCEKVIHSVKAFNEQDDFHHIKSHGIIDRDRRTSEDTKRLNSKGIWILDVAEAENLLLIEEIVKAVASHMGKDPNAVFNEIKSNLLKFFQSQIESQILLHFQEEIKRELITAANFTKRILKDVISEIDGNIILIDKQKIFDSIKKDFNQILSADDYDGVLRVFNLKNALIPNSNVCALTDIKNKDSYLNLVMTLLKRKDNISETITNAIDKRVMKSS
jgi:hypothetical protein